jgi:tetratricopeptide (TPR) repeat protein
MVLLCVPGLMTAGPAIGQPDGCAPPRQVGAGSLDELTWNRLNAILAEVAAERYEASSRNLRTMLERAGRDRYLRAVLNQALAQVEWARGRFDPALAYFEEAVALDALPDTAHFGLMLQLAQLYYMQGRLDESLERLEQWFCAASEDQLIATAYLLKASIHVQQGDFRRGLEAIDAAIAMEEVPQESWLQLKLTAHYELGQHAQAAETLQLLTAHWPGNKLYWVQLAQVYYQLELTERALAVLALADGEGMLDRQSDIAFLAGLYSEQQMPYQAARVLERGIRDGTVPSDQRHWTLVAEAWLDAAELENSLTAYELAGQLASDGGADLRCAYVLVELERWPDALAALDRALKKGGLDAAQWGEAYLLRGLANYNMGDLDGAGADWSRAGRYEQSREAAGQWIEYLRAERDRRAS